MFNKKNNQCAHFWTDAGYKTIDCKKNISKGIVCFLKDANILTGYTSNEQDVDRVAFTDNWISYLSSIFGVIAFVLPNVPPLGKLLFVIPLIALNCAFHSQVFKRTRKLLRYIIIMVSSIFIILSIAYSIKNEINIIINSNNSLLISLLPVEYKPLPVKVSKKKDPIDFYCANMEPVLDIWLLKQGDTDAAVTEIDLIIKKFKEFSEEDIVEHSWINDNPSEILFQRENNIQEEHNIDFSSNYKYVRRDYINIGGRIYHDKPQQQLFVIDKGEQDPSFTVHDSLYLRVIPEIKDSGHYVIQLLINYNDGKQKICKSEAIDFYFLNDEIEEVLKEDPNSADYFKLLGDAFYNRGDYSKALEYYNKAVAISEVEYGTENLKLTITYNDIGLVYHEMGEYDLAQEYLEKALKISEKELESEHLNIATTYANLALVNADKGQYDKSLKYYKKALEIYKKS